jgi:diguanylate cyclase (GGDEF)-like protein/PAS domain S-box-containing protein
MTPNMDHPLGGTGDTESRLRLAELALDNSLDSILIHDTSGHLIFFNDAAAAAMGLSSEEFAKLGPWEFAGEDTDEGRSLRMLAIQQAGDLTFHSHSTRPDGTRAIAEVHSRWVETDDGPIVVSVSHDATERLTAREALEHMAFHDPLTGLANRALFDDRLDIAIAAARRHGNILGVAFIDVDDFKEINDSFGHDVGDRVLVALAERLSRASRADDTVARLGGDELAVIFPRLSSAADLTGIAGKYHRLLSKPVRVSGKRVAVSASIGLSLFDPEKDDARSLLIRADVAMYNAKQGTPHLRAGLVRAG